MPHGIRRPIDPATIHPADMDRFWTRTTPGADGCLEWAGYATPKGYGIVHLGGRALHAHRVAAVFSAGVDRADMDVDHLCRNRLCVNPTHLEFVPSRTNTGRGANRAGETIRAFDERGECAKGHDLTAPNAWKPHGRNGRRCRECYNEHYREARRLARLSA